jgi:hypothetical protein
VTREVRVATAHDAVHGEVMHGDEAGIAEQSGRDPYRVVRRVLFVLVAFAMLGTGAELVLLGHYETVWQWTPLALFGLGLAAHVPAMVRPGRATLRLFQSVMILFVAAGVLGLWLHYSGNAEFELEMQPTMGGRELVWKSLTGATPALAPGSMILFGLLGLTATYHHPRLRRADVSQAQ